MKCARSIGSGCWAIEFYLSPRIRLGRSESNWLANAAVAHVQASSIKVCFSYSSLDVEAHMNASSAYCRNSSASVMTKPCPVTPYSHLPGCERAHAGVHILYRI